jgi:hypothetical protein
VRVRMGVFVVTLLLCPACSSTISGTGDNSSARHSALSPAPSNSSASPDGRGPFEAVLCRRLSVLFSNGKLPRAFRPSTTYVPTVLTHNGFGQSDAECEVDPRLGIYYLALIWDRTVPSAPVNTFERQLRAAGFRHTPGESLGNFTAPSGIPAVVAGVRTDMQRVIIMRFAKDRLTAVVWI